MSISPRQLPSWGQIRDKINQLALEEGTWAGAPMPVHGLPLVIEPRYPYARLNGFCFDGDVFSESEETVSETDQIRVINTWFSHRLWAQVYICDCGPGTSLFAVKNPVSRTGQLNLWISTIGASQAWSLNAEIQALEKLLTLVEGHTYRHYILTGSFLETSKKSNVTYLFRRLRPTVAMTHTKDDGARYLTSLCLHPIGHYKNSWAGVMVPTDDLIAHLLLMRADEHYFWRKANQHEIWQPGAGI